MTASVSVFDSLALLLSYPGPDYRRLLDSCRREAPAEVARPLDELARELASLSDAGLEELFVQTFELNAACSPETGWHLFGEQYERGEFLVYLRGRLREAGVRESTELPDHLSHVLRLLPRQDPGETAELVSSFLYSSIEKMISALDGKKNPFELLLQAARASMKPWFAAQAEEVLS